MRLWQNVLDAILPRACVGCLVEGSFFCNECAGRLRPPPPLSCPFCDTSTPGGRTCTRHQSCALGGLITCGFYHDPILQSLIKRLKYQHTEELAHPLASLMARAMQKFHTLLPDTPVLVPLPLARARERSRGFNQAALLALEIAGTLHLPLVADELKRIRNTEPQAKLDDDARRTNLANAFAVRDPEMIVGRSILLIDDVLTTGATLEAAASALRKAGAASIIGVVLARG